MAKRDRWYFTREELENSPSRKCGIDKEKELSSRQQAANLIQDIGQKLKVTQLVINTAIVYMHRFYTFHSFSKFRRNGISSCALFLAAKVEEQPRKLEHVIKVSQLCIYRENLDTKSEQYQSLAAELVYHENLMLRTLGFDLSVQHPHTSVVNCCHLVRAPKALTQASYFMATNSLHLTNLCLRYKPSVVACICIYFVCKWARFELARSVEGKDWWAYVDPTVNLAMLEELTGELLSIFQKCPSRMKRILDSNKLPNSPSLRPIDNDFNKNDLSHKSTFDDTSNKVSPDYHQLSESRHKTMPSNLFKDHQINKKDAAINDQLSAKSVSKPPLQSNSNNKHHSNTVLPTAQSKESESVQQNVSNKNNNLSAEEKLKQNSSADINLQTSLKTKSNLSVIASNTFSNNSSSSNATFNESLLDSHAMFSNDSNDMSELNAAHKKDMLDFKMEFSDNDDSNPSNNNISLTSTLMMNDSNDSKSLSHFSNKSNLDINSQNYDFKIKPNTFSQFPSSISSAKSDTDSQPPVNTNTLISNSYSKLPSNASSQPNVLPNVLLNQFSDDSLSDKSGMSLFNSKKSTALSSGSKLNEPFKNVNASVDSKTISNPPYNSFMDSLGELQPNLANILPSTSKTLQPGTKLSHDNAKSLFNQNLSSNISQPPNIGSELDETSNHSKHLKQHKEKHKHKDKHKHKHKDKHKHKHKDKDKEKNRDKYNVEQSSFKVLLSPAKEKDESEKPAPIKLKISKQKFSIDEPEKDADKKPLKLKISLSNHQRSSSESPSNTEPVSKKRKHAQSEKGTKPEKTAKSLNDHNDQFYANSNKSNKKAA